VTVVQIKTGVKPLVPFIDETKKFTMVQTADHMSGQINTRFR
jgi:hypothetical protein